MTKLRRISLSCAGILVGAAAFFVAPIAGYAQHSVVQKAESGGVLTMPAGDFSRAAVSITDAFGGETPRLSPTPAAELNRIKALIDPTSNAPDSASSDSVMGHAPKPLAVVANCAMNVGAGSAPSDVHGAAGPANIIEVTNSAIMVRNKSTCALVSSMTLKSFFGSGFTIPAAESLFDPRVLYDRLHNRCIVTVESRNSGNTDQFLYVASSRTSSCTSWRRIRFVLSRVSPAALFCKNAASNFYDYPNAGYNFSRLVVTANNFTGSPGSYIYSSLLSIDKIALHGTATVFARCFRGGSLPSNMAPAVVGDTSGPMYILSPGSGGGSAIQRRQLTPVGSGSGIADTLGAASNISIPAWLAAPDAAQPNGQKLDTLDGRFQSASKQIGSVLWNVHAVKVGAFARWRLYKLSTTGTLVLFSRTPTTSTCANLDHLFNPSIDTNSTVTTALAFVTASRTCPSQATAGRAAHLIFRGANSSNTGWVFNTVATSTTQFTILGGSSGATSCNAGSSGSCRWGDYSSTQIDPSTPTTAWGFNQIIVPGSIGGASSQFNWSTRGGRVN